MHGPSIEHLIAPSSFVLVEGDRLFNSSGHVRRHESTVQKAPEATGSATATGAFTSDGASTSAGGSTATTTPLVNQVSYKFHFNLNGRPLKMMLV